MFSKACTVSVAAVAGAVISVVAFAGPASAAPAEQIPRDVSEAFANSALREAPASAEHHRGQADDDPATREAPAFSGPIRADDIHDVHAFSAEFLSGAPTAQAVTPAGQWLAAVKGGNDVLGTIMVRKPQGGPAELGGFTDDAALGTALGELRPGEVLIEDQRVMSYFALKGDTVRPVNDNARIELPRAAPIAALQAVVAVVVPRGRRRVGRP